MSNDKTALLVLAAGMGSRYGGLKQIDPVGPSGEAILDFSVYDAIKAGFDKVVFVIRHDFEDIFKEKVIAKYEGKIDIECVFQDINDLPDGYSLPEGRVKPWGTVHAILAARNVIDCPFAVVNADDFYGRSAYEAAHEFLISETMKANSTKDANEKFNYGMVGFKLNNTLSENGSVARGVCQVDENGNLSDIKELLKIFKMEDGAEDRPENGENTKLTGNEHVSMNFWTFSPDLMDQLKVAFDKWIVDNVNVEKSECLIPTEIDNFIKSGSCDVKVIDTDSKWFGVTYKEDKPVVVATIQSLIDKGVYPSRLF